MPDGFRQIWSRKPFNILKGPRMSDDPAQGAKGQGTDVGCLAMCCAALKGPLIKKPNSGRARSRPFEVDSGRGFSGRTRPYPD